MAQKSPVCRLGGRHHVRESPYLLRDANAGQIAERSGLDISLDARHLPSQVDTRTSSQLQAFVELHRCVHVGISVDGSKASKNSLAEAG